MDAVAILIPLLVAGGVTALLTPLVSRLATQVGAVDLPSERSVAHRAGIPLLGGLAVAAGFTFGLLAALGTLRPVFPFWHLWGPIFGSGVILSVGILDDRFGLGAGAKFAGQIVASAIAISAGFQMDHLTEPISRTTLTFPEPVAWVVTLVWIVGITNAMNLIDGLDGLATGVGAIICATLMVILAQEDAMLHFCFGVALLGSLLGFLPFNFPPARIFLGDTGALFVGYNLALLPLLKLGYQQVSVMTFVVPLLALALPILDTAISIVRRARIGRSPFRADRLHLHHRLLARRGSTRGAVLQFYFVTLCFSLIAVSFHDLRGYVAAACLVVVSLLTLRLLANLGVFSFESAEELGLGDRAPAPEEKHP